MQKAVRITKIVVRSCVGDTIIPTWIKIFVYMSLFICSLLFEESFAVYLKFERTDIYTVIFPLSIVFAFFLVCIVYLRYNLTIYTEIPTESLPDTLSIIIMRYVHIGLASLAVFQVTLWIIDHQNTIHEPRSVLMLALSGIIAVLLNEYHPISTNRITTPSQASATHPQTAQSPAPPEHPSSLPLIDGQYLSPYV